MLLRHGRVYPKPSTWAQEHHRWLAHQQFEEPISELAFADLIATVEGLTARKQALAEPISEIATDPAWWATVARLRCFRGVDTLTAFAIHLELGADWERFEKAQRVGSWLGLTPSRTQSGETDRQGAITKTGSMLARRLLVKSAWHAAREPRIGVTLRNRQQGQPDHVLQIANRPSTACTASTRTCAQKQGPGVDKIPAFQTGNAVNEPDAPPS
jgi:transposase